LTPVKRSDNEYIIFLPETYHSITAKPDIASVDGLQDVDVKLIPYIGSQNNNGYTKITVRTKSSETKLNVNNEVSGQESKINNELSKLINKTTPVALKSKTTPNIANNSSLNKTKIATGNTSTKEVLKPKNATNSISGNLNKEKTQLKNESISYSYAKSAVNNKKSDTIQQKAALNVEKSTAAEQKQALEENIPENKTANSITSQELQLASNMTSPITVSKESSPAINKTVNKKVNKPAKHNNISIKLILVSLIALLMLFIVVLRYFKSVLMKQMKLAEEKAISKNSEVTLPRKQPVSSAGNKSRSQSAKQIPAKRPVAASGSAPKSKPNNIKVIKGYEIENDKGIYLIQTKYNQILIGTINSEVFLLKEFNCIQNPTLTVRKEKSLKTKNVYYVQVSNWRGLVSVAADNIYLELVLDKALITR
jgi:hypothetical protein